MLEEAVSIIEENFIEAIALAISFASLVFAYKRTEQLEQQGELINRNSQREAVRAGFLNNNQLYQPISDGLIDLVRTHPKAWTGEDPETVRRDWEDSRIKNLLHIERIMDLYYYAYHLYRTGIIHDNEWDSYLLWISDWKDDDQTRGVEGSIFNQVRRNWYQGDYAIQMKKLYDEPSLYRPVLTECDIEILRIISGDSCPLAKIRFNHGDDSTFETIKNEINESCRCGVNGADKEDTSEDGTSLNEEDILEVRLRVLLDKNLIEATDGTSLRGASYKITNDGEMIKSEDDKSDKNNTTKLKELYSEEDQYGDDSDKECKKATRIKYFDEIIKSDIFLK